MALIELTYHLALLALCCVILCLMGAIVLSGLVGAYYLFSYVVAFLYNIYINQIRKHNFVDIADFINR